MAAATAALVPAAEKGDLATVEDCVAKGADVDVTGRVSGHKDKNATKGVASMAGCRKNNVGPHSLTPRERTKYPRTLTRALPPSERLSDAFKAFGITRFLASSYKKK